MMYIYQIVAIIQNTWCSPRYYINKYLTLFAPHKRWVVLFSTTYKTTTWCDWLQLVAGDMLKFLELNTDRRQLLVHGFSVGGYVWGELLGMIEQDRERYAPLLQRIMGLIWDSAADMQDIPMGLPTAVFPKNLILQNALRKYVK